MSGEQSWRVLIVDDEEDIREVLRLSLADSGYDVALAEDAEKGLELLESFQPRLVITDLRMPGMNGLEFLEKIKSRRPEVEVIVATAYGEMDTAIRALQLDASDFVTKPISEDALKLSLARARERYASRRQLADYAALLEAENVETTQELLRTIAFQRKLIDSSMDGILGLDRRELAATFNRALEDMLGLTRYEALGRIGLGDLFDPEHEEQLRRALADEKYGGPGRLFMYESEIRAPLGRPIPVQISAAEILEGGVREGLVFFFRDLREIRRMEREMADQAQILHQDKMVSLGRLAAGVVHEINNPLSGILNYARLMSRVLSRGELSAEAREKFVRYLELVESETERCSGIVSGLLAFSRRPKPEPTTVNVKELIEKTILLSRHKLNLSGIDLKIPPSPGLPTVKGDPNQLQQCLINLIFNAIDAMPQGGRLTISAAAENGFVSISVTDTGRGMEQDEISHIFEPFYTTKSEGYGVGLGLSTVYGIIERHGGRIQVESRPGEGSTFSLFLPV